MFIINHPITLIYFVMDFYEICLSLIIPMMSIFRFIIDLIFLTQPISIYAISLGIYLIF